VFVTGSQNVRQSQTLQLILPKLNCEKEKHLYHLSRVVVVLEAVSGAAQLLGKAVTIEPFDQCYKHFLSVIYRLNKIN
jgi:hypothetical protein